MQPTIEFPAALRVRPESQMLFEPWRRKQPIARLPYRAVRYVLVEPDGKRLLSLAQASERFDLRPETLRDLWLSTWSGALTEGELEAIEQRAETSLFTARRTNQ
jgi:hypothetical protein